MKKPIRTLPSLPVCPFSAHEILSHEFWEEATPEKVYETFVWQDMLEGRDYHTQNSPLHIAIRHCKNVGAIEALLELGHRLEVFGQYDASPLVIAAGRSSLAVIQLLIDYGANINSSDKNLQDPLMYAALANTVEVVELLLRSGAAVNSRDKWRGNPLQFAASREDGFEIVKLLVENGADVNFCGRHERTPLIESLMVRPNYASADYLLKAGARTGPSDDNSKTAYEYARQHGNCPPELLAALKPWAFKSGLP
jgi:ankyrin repeat protein